MVQSKPGRIIFLFLFSSFFFMADRWYGRTIQLRRKTKDPTRWLRRRLTAPERNSTQAEGSEARRYRRAAPGHPSLHRSPMRDEGTNEARNEVRNEVRNENRKQAEIQDRKNQDTVSRADTSTAAPGRSAPSYGVPGTGGAAGAADPPQERPSGEEIRVAVSRAVPAYRHLPSPAGWPSQGQDGRIQDTVPVAGAAP